MQEDGYLRPWDVVDHLREEESRFSTGSIRSSTQLVRNENSAGSISLKEAVSATIPEIPLSAADLMSFAWQISCGMVRIFQKNKASFKPSFEGAYWHAGCIWGMGSGEDLVSSAWQISYWIVRIFQ